MSEVETKKCRECHSEVPVKAKRCAHCKTNLRPWVERHPILTLFLFMIGITILMPILFSITAPSETPYTSQITPNTAVFEPYSAIVDASELRGTGITDINVWNSYSDRSSVKFRLKGGENVNVISKDTANNYCEISYVDKSGWLSCDWLR